MPKIKKSKKQVKRSYIFPLLIVLAVSIAFLFFVKYQKSLSLSLTEKNNQTQFSPIAREYDIRQMWGEPVKGLYPELNNPKYITSKEAAKIIGDNDEVILVNTKKGPIAYPNFILSYHHVANEIIDDTPVALAYCCQTDSVHLFSRIVDGKTLNFAVLGPLYWGNKVIFDKETDSYWLSLTGEAISGKMKGKRLESFKPVDRTSWKFVKSLPYLTVLAPVREVKFYRDWYQRMKIEGAGLFALTQKKKADPRLSAYTSGLGINVGKDAVFIPITTIKTDQAVNTQVGGWAIVAIQNEELSSRRIFRRTVDGRDLTFKKINNGLKDLETGNVWNNDGLGISGSLKNRQLEAPVYTQVYWYAWAAFYPETVIKNN